MHKSIRIFTLDDDKIAALSDEERCALGEQWMDLSAEMGDIDPT